MSGPRLHIMEPIILETAEFPFKCNTLGFDAPTCYLRCRRLFLKSFQTCNSKNPADKKVDGEHL